MVTMMSTGDEAPKGFEGYFTDKERDAKGALTIDCVALKQLSQGEIDEMDALRTRALDNYTATTGNELERISIHDELALAPEGSDPAEKLIFRAYKGGDLVAYAHVLCGWPRANEWTVEQLLLDPTYRLKGIGTKVIGAVESLARTAEARTTSILSLPSREGAQSFWNHLGYEDKTEELKDELSGSHLKIMRKVL